MTQDSRHHVSREHREVSALLPWYVNGSIGEQDRQRVDAHLSACADCRNDLAQEQRVYRAMTAETAVEYMPAASLKRLQARLDGISVPEANSPANAAADARSAAAPGRRFMRWPGLMAASIAVMAVALSLLAADRWLRLRGTPAQPNYYTVTTAAPRPQGEVIRAVFSPTITLVELQSILDEAQLRIVSGPTEAGVYSLAAKSGRPVSSSLALLREHAKVRFAESTQATARAGDSP
jgi:anti-sigma-K factor RskA